MQQRTNILVVVDYTTCYPKAIPTCAPNAKTIAAELLKVLARIGVPKEILTDQGTNFTSQLLKEVCDEFKIKTQCKSVSHSQMDGLVE